MRWLLLVTTLLLGGCSASWHLKMAIKKNPGLQTTTTMTVTDTVVIDPVVVRDTIVTSTNDTIILEKERLKIKIVRINDTLIVDGQCAGDTIVKFIDVPIEKLVYNNEEKWFQKIYRWSFYLLLLALGSMVIRVIIKKGLIGK